MDGPALVWDFSAMDRPSAPIPAFALYGEEADFPDILHVETIVDRAARHGWTIAPHRHLRLHQFVHVGSGGGTVTVDGRAMRMDPPAVVNLPPHCVHSFRLEEGAQGDVLTLPVAAWAALLLSEPEVAPVLARPFVTGVTGSFAAGMERVRAELRDPGPLRRLRLRAAVGEAVLALLVAHEASGAAGGTVARGEDPRLVQVRALIEEAPSIRRTVEETARAAGMSVRHLSRLCLDGTGQSAQALIHAAVLREACRLLAYTQLQVAEIGHRLGFDDPSYFSRFFLREAGLAPRDYRRRLNG